MKVTVAVTTYNRWNSCYYTLVSILNNVYQDIEILLIDDCSNQTMPSEVNELISRNNIIYYRHKKNLGLAEARNTAINLATGNFFSFCDDDDQWPTSLISNFVKISKEKEVNVVLGYSQKFKEYFDKHNMGLDVSSIKSIMLMGFSPPVGSQFYSLDLLKRCGGYSAKVRSGVDHDLWINLLSCETKVGICWNSTAIINSDLLMDRMTLNHITRQNEIKNSLVIWKKKIIPIMGDDFFYRFQDNYFRHIKMKFFISAIKSKNLKWSVTYLLDYSIIIFCIKKKILSRIFKIYMPPFS